MRGISIDLEFHHSALHNLEAVKRVAQAIVEQGFVPVEGFAPNWQPVEDLDHYVRTNFYDHSNDPEWRQYFKALWKVVLTFLLPEMPGFTSDISFNFSYYNPQRNWLAIGALVDLGGYVRDEREYVEPLAQQLQALGVVLYPLLQPMLGWVDEVHGNPTESEHSAKLELRAIPWVNFFGPAYVERYGRDFLLSLPGYKTELLPDGGVFHQLSPTFVAPSEQEAKRLRRWVIAYCAEHGLKVTCRAPYVIPGLTFQPEPEELASDAEVQEYLQQALAVTLVLTDGTRVKPIYIPWADLTLRQRQMALEAIKQAAIAEIKRPGRKRIRFEFNEIPDELDHMLADLVGRDNPDFEWVQVEMEP